MRLSSAAIRPRGIGEVLRPQSAALAASTRRARCSLAALELLPRCAVSGLPGFWKSPRAARSLGEARAPLFSRSEAPSDGSSSQRETALSLFVLLDLKSLVAESGCPQTAAWQVLGPSWRAPEGPGVQNSELTHRFPSVVRLSPRTAVEEALDLTEVARTLADTVCRALAVAQPEGTGTSRRLGRSPRELLAASRLLRSNPRRRAARGVDARRREAPRRGFAGAQETLAKP